MTKDNFLQDLREALQGQISSAEVENNLKYYKEYIKEEVAKGKSEQDVMEALGTPEMIAQSIVQMSGGRNEHEKTAQDTSRMNHTVHETRRAAGSVHHSVFPFALDTWWKILLLVLAVVAVCWIGFTLIKGIARFVISHWLIVVAIVVVIALIIKYKMDN